MVEYIYLMVCVCKVVGEKFIFDDVMMVFFFGVKIGMVGLNGVGKLMIFKIMVGFDMFFNGEVKFVLGYLVGILM